MLAKKYRLPIQTAVGKKGKEFRFPDFLIKILPGPENFSRFGVVLKKGSVKNASERNRIRRAILESIRMRRKDHDIPENDFLIITGSGISGMTGADIKKEISDAFDVIMKQR